MAAYRGGRDKSSRARGPWATGAWAKTRLAQAAARQRKAKALRKRQQAAVPLTRAWTLARLDHLRANGFQRVAAPLGSLGLPHVVPASVPQTPHRAFAGAILIGTAVLATLVLGVLAVVPSWRPRGVAIALAPIERLATLAPGLPLKALDQPRDTQLPSAPPSPQITDRGASFRLLAQEASSLVVSVDTAGPLIGLAMPGEARGARGGEGAEALAALRDGVAAQPPNQPSLVLLEGTHLPVRGVVALDAASGEDRRCVDQAGLDGEIPDAKVSDDPAEFGRALAAAALRQTRQFVVYSDRYRTLAYPKGDVPALYGVCTDVVVRAYRALGIDLQVRVHTSGIGSGDANIAHRRTFTLRRYFSSRGAALPITAFAEDYQAGDIVTYLRPQNRGSRDHIAIVADVAGPSGRPMIIHNRGWGPQLEDALFVDKLTGHYRYSKTHDRLALALALRKTPRARSATHKKDVVQLIRRSKLMRSLAKAKSVEGGERLKDNSSR